MPGLPRIYDEHGQPFPLAREKASGGEGAVYTVTGQPGILAKLYFKMEPGYDRKLKHMIDNPPEDPGQKINHRAIAWPLMLLHDQSRSVCGFTMPYIGSAVSLFQVLNPASRKSLPPEFQRAINGRFLLRTGQNLAAANAATHKKKYVIGDSNESNYLVTLQALVTSIDCDSYQVMNGGQVFYCRTYKDAYLAPELWKAVRAKTLDTTERLPEHDNWALAVMIYQLLLHGNHPFRANWSGQGDSPTTAEKVENGWWPYDRQACKVPLSLPYNAPRIGWLHPEISALMRRCFSDGYRNPKARPTAAEWQVALANVETRLKKCSKGHYYADHLVVCPWCPRNCSNCSTPLRWGDLFCNRCGAKV